MEVGWRVVDAGKDRDRGVSARTADAWRAAEHDFDLYLDSTGIRDDTVTWSTEVLQLSYDDRDAAVAKLMHDTKNDGLWSYMTARVGDGPRGFLLAMPIRDGGPPRPEAIPFVELHSKAVAWWLTCIWRIRQLSKAAGTLADQDLTIPAAATVRSLVETVAAFDYDGRRIRDAWSAMKEAGASPFETGALDRHREVTLLFLELIYGSKFTDAAPEMKEAWTDRVSRRNVLTQLAKYARRVEGVDVATDYEWLCNVVHPSIGTTYVYSSEPFMHATKTHMDRLWTERPTMVIGRQGATDPGHVETTVARSATTALANAVKVARSTLRVVDDIALTTDAPSLYRRPQFRGIHPAQRNEPCPCGSGLKSKRCPHLWGQPAPDLPERFDATLDSDVSGNYGEESSGDTHSL